MLLSHVLLVFSNCTFHGASKQNNVGVSYYPVRATSSAYLILFHVQP